MGKGKGIDILVRNAKLKDLPGVVKVNHSLHYPERKDGFLIQKRPVEEFKKILGICKYFFIAEVGRRVVGYLIVMDETADFLDNEIFSFYVGRYKNFVFIEQIGVLPDYQRRGIGRALYKKLLEIERKRVLVDFMIKPRNSQTISFHKTIGFKSIGDIIHLKNGWKARVYEFKGKRI